MAKLRSEVKQVQLVTPDYGDYSNAGVEDLPAGRVPPLRIIQPGNPDLNKEGSRVQGFEPGDIYESISGVRLSAVHCVVCYVGTSWTTWKPGAGGSNEFQQRLAAKPTGATWKEKMGHVTPDGLIAVFTRSFYVIHHGNDGGYSPYLLEFSKTGLAEADAWISVLNRMGINQHGKRNIRLPICARSFDVSTVEESNKLLRWFRWKVSGGDDLLEPREPFFQAALEFIDIAKRVHQGATEIESRHIMLQAPNDDIPF